MSDHELLRRRACSKIIQGIRGSCSVQRIQYRITNVARKRSSLNTTTKLPCSNHALNTNKMSTLLKAIISMVSVGFCSVVSSLLKFMALAQKRSSTTSTTGGTGPAIKKPKGMMTLYYTHGSYMYIHLLLCENMFSCLLFFFVYVFVL